MSLNAIGELQYLGCEVMKNLCAHSNESATERLGELAVAEQCQRGHRFDFVCSKRFEVAQVDVERVEKCLQITIRSLRRGTALTPTPPCIQKL